ncbi:unnamed protein product [Rhizoctonia solani]|uniref:Uncharacterized protein n=1 Tax=Rhizoctonia solani TaxID=456999 RepID=A0A8H3CJX6_9AGAM|nr:unnamed protein product [Rhizoctonia solani]
MDRPNVSSNIDENQGNTASPVSTPRMNSNGEQSINKPAGRKSRWRSFSRDPFSPPSSEDLSNEPQNLVYQKPEGSEGAPRVELKHPGSKWIHLFYDLAWTASFASLAQNGKFIKPMEIVSYFVFFAAVLWLWASQKLYSIYFYTNDWFHFISIFLQLFIFGMLAATTNGYDVTAYISHSPGLDGLVSESDLSQLPDNLQLENFSAERTDLLSARTMALAFAITRFLHLVQYLRACVYARWGKGTKVQNHESWAQYVHRIIHPEMYAIVIGLIFSNMIFFAVVGVVFSEFGTTVAGASLKVGLWVGGFLLEIISHLWYPAMQKLKRPQPTKRTIGLPNPESLSGYFDTITTVILGEGINGFAGTLASILSIPGVGRAIAVNVVSTAFIIWFIAYIYFEGPHSGTTPKGEGIRRMIWMVMYLPLLASIFLLFVGMKNQFLLTASMGKDGVPENVQTLVDTYYNVNSTFLNQDLRLQNQDPRLSMYSKILIELMDGSLQSARYILIFAAAILISLGLQSLAHSEIKANDPYQRVVITCRLIMGIVLSLLLLLNLGKYDDFFVPSNKLSQRIGVFQWLEAFWVLPTIAIAYGIQFLIEVTLTRFMDTTKENKRKNSDTEAARPPNLTSQSYYSEPDKDADYSGRQG